MERGLLNSQPGENVWARESHLITSIDFAKRNDVMPSIASAQWDLIIVDEAHKMAAYQYGEKVGQDQSLSVRRDAVQSFNPSIVPDRNPTQGRSGEFQIVPGSP